MLTLTYNQALALLNTYRDELTGKPFKGPVDSTVTNLQLRGTDKIGYQVFVMSGNSEMTLLGYLKKHGLPVDREAFGLNEND